MKQCKGCANCGYCKSLWERQKVIMSQINYVAAQMIEAGRNGDAFAIAVFDKKRKQLNDQLHIMTEAEE